MGMLVVTALVTFFVQRQELWSIGKKAAVKMAGTAVVDVLAPGLHYEEKENGNHFLAKVEKILFPIADYTVQIKSYETDAESTLSYEMILAMEALDENYVDENGQVVMQNNGGTDSPQPADGTQNADNPQAADGAQNADNSQAAATAQNPDIFDYCRCPDQNCTDFFFPDHIGYFHVSENHFRNRTLRDIFPF